jgi:hypothetical protein
MLSLVRTMFGIAIRQHAKYQQKAQKNLHYKIWGNGDQTTTQAGLNLTRSPI